MPNDNMATFATDNDVGGVLKLFVKAVSIARTKKKNSGQKRTKEGSPKT